ncbi:hypothetical protein HUT18_13855 [Streptomyces sp. NA04227]|uniref:hypothetical protein n=1 Tax=Streptomyces sp. NA04227 TaxID=2742136 RepID=UPI001591FEDA|nr:hypothetical protein [Streptomyces sp. NA04227]QKW07315.1 hypothetical protein HUT18_13855 [Streptomyces sp. NA04227]
MAGYLGYRAIPLPLAFSLGYLLPLGLLAASWLRPRTRRERGTRVALGIVSCVAAYLYSQVALYVLYTVAILVWLNSLDWAWR